MRRWDDMNGFGLGHDWDESSADACFERNIRAAIGSD